MKEIEIKPVTDDQSECVIDGGTPVGSVISVPDDSRPGIFVVYEIGNRTSSKGNEFVPCRLRNKSVIREARIGQRPECGRCRRKFICRGFEFRRE